MTEHRIARIETFAVRYPEPHDDNRDRYLTLARLECNDGAIGWGECIAQWPEAALATQAVIDRGFAALLIGEDPLDPKRLWTKMRDHAYWHGAGGIVSFAISALDIAVWDLAGQLTGLPVHRLLGGKLFAQAPACASVILNTLDLEALHDEFADYRQRGYRAVKGGWGKVPEAGFGTDSARDLKVAETIRNAIGPDTRMSLDVSARAKWTATHAFKMAQALSSVDLAWLEDPLHHEDHAGYRRIRAAVSTQLATGERCWTLNDYKRLVCSGAVDIILVDPGRIEGISAMKEIVDHAASERVRFSPHSWSSAINTAAALQVFASSSNGEVFELKPNPSPMQHELVEEPFEQQGGFIAIDDRPGLGLNINEDAIRKYAFS